MPTALAMMASPPLAASSSALALTGEERAFAKHLQRDIVAPFERTCGSEQRVDVYLALNKVLCLDDTHGSVRVLQCHLPTLLRVIHDDLQHATMQDVVHIALRTLSYFMHHPSLSRSFGDVQTESFLTDVMSRLASTQDEPTYKLCLWCLTMQNFDMARLDFLPRIVEAMVQAIVNPFDSRRIVAQALKGLHLMLLKFKPLMMRTSTLSVWFRPVTSRLSSSDKTTRHLVSLVLLEAASFCSSQREELLSDEMLTTISAALTEYALPVMHEHVVHERHREALTLWKIGMVLLKRVFSSDGELLQRQFVVSETAMSHADASVRLHSMETWRHLVGVFRLHKDWIFDKYRLVTLMNPVVKTLKNEAMLNIVHAALATWRVVVTAVVEDFNAYAASQSDCSVEALQRCAKKWRFWFVELVRKVVMAAIEREQRPLEESAVNGQSAVSFEAVYETIDATVREIFAPLVVVAVAPSTATLAAAAVVVARPPPSAANRGSESSMTTAASSASSGGFASPTRGERQLSPMDQSEHDDQLLDDAIVEHSASASLSRSLAGDTSQLQQHSRLPTPTTFCPALSGHLLGLALVTPDVHSFLSKLAQTANDATCWAADRVDLRQRCESLAFFIWEGMCVRLQHAGTDASHDEATQKLRLRIARMSLDFAFGNAASGSSTTTSSSMDSQASALMPSLPTDSLMTAADLIQNSSSSSSLVSRTFGIHGRLSFRWQVRLLRDIMAVTTSSQELTALLQHPKSKTAHHLLTRIDGIVERDDVYKVWLAQWDHAAPVSTDGQRKENGRIDFSAKRNVALCVLLYVVMTLAVLFDECGENDSQTSALSQVVKFSQEVVEMVLKCVDPASGRANDTVTRFVCIVSNSPRAATQLMAKDGGENTASGSGKLLRLCARLAHRSEESQANAEVLLQLQRSPARDVSPERAALVVSSHSAVLDAPISTPAAPRTPELATNAVPTGSEGSSLPSPCMLQPIEPSVRPPTHEQAIQNQSLSPARRPISVAAAPRTPQTPSRATQVTNRLTSTPSRQQIRTPIAGALRSPVGCIFPDLVSCTESISHLLRHFPQVFRTFAPYYKIKTVGDLAAMTADQVNVFPVKEPLATTMKALEAFYALCTRPQHASSSSATSPFPQQRLFSSSPAAQRMSLLSSSPSPRRIQKRPVPSPSHPLPHRLPSAPLPLESPQRKRARRSLRELSSELDDAETKHSGNAIGTSSSAHGFTSASTAEAMAMETDNEPAKLANRVTFRLDIGGGETKISHPGEDSQDALRQDRDQVQDEEAGKQDDNDREAKESVWDKNYVFMIKTLQHLNRGLKYSEKLEFADENSMQSETTLRSDMDTIRTLEPQVNEAQSLVVAIHAQLVRIQTGIERARAAGTRNVGRLQPPL